LLIPNVYMWVAPKDVPARRNGLARANERFELEPEPVA
jgi:hypothetical protein